MLNRKLLFVTILLIVLLSGQKNIWAQCPKINGLQIENSTDSSICVPDLIRLSAKVNYIPAGAELRWYSGTTSSFNPLLGQGTLLEVMTLPPVNFPSVCPQICPSLQMLYTEPCNTQGNSFQNEFVAIHSGGGFYVSNLRLELDAKSNPGNESVNNSIEVGPDFCQVLQPDPNLISQLRKGACNSSNLISAGPGDYIPPGAMVIFFLHPNVASDFNISEYCSVDQPIYILQNACPRNRSAFSTNSKCVGAERFMYQSISLKGCSTCFDELNYDLCGFPESVSSYVVSIDKPLSSFGNGGVKANSQCAIPISSNFIKTDTTIMMDVFLDDINDPLCGQTIYYKVVLIPNGSTCSSVQSSAFPLKVECPLFNIASISDTICSGAPLKITLNGPPNAIYSWEVNAPIEVSGLESTKEQNSQIIQTPILNGERAVEVLYEISIVSGTCFSDLETAKITVLPSIKANIKGNLQFCKNQQTTLSVESDHQVLWSTGTTNKSISVTEPGIYSVFINNGFCNFSDTVEVEEVDQILPEINGDSIICNNGDVKLSGPEGYDSYLWNTGSTNREIIINSSGDYTLEVALGDCKGTGSFTVKEAADLDIDVQIKPVGCAGVNDGKIVLEVEVADDIIFWKDGSKGKVLENLASGTYIYNIIRSSTCNISNTIELISSPNLEPIFEVLGKGCVDSELGKIRLLEVSNGIEPLEFSFNGDDFSSVTEWSHLETGDYTVSIRDAGACTRDITISVDEGIPLLITMSDIIEVAQGKNTELLPIIDGLEGDMVYQWIPSEGLSCSDCLNPNVSSFENIDYQFIAINSKGCRDSVWVAVQVIPKIAINIPQVFSPNNDGVNDKFQILSPSEDLLIVRFNIFNRWGKNIFSASNFKIGEAFAAWDGTVSGKPAPADIYLYEVEFQSVDSSVTIERGVVSLIR